MDLKSQSHWNAETEHGEWEYLYYMGMNLQADLVKKVNC